jgi:hypothetical protein
VDEWLRWLPHLHGNQGIGAQVQLMTWDENHGNSTYDNSPHPLRPADGKKS